MHQRKNGTAAVYDYPSRRTPRRAPTSDARGNHAHPQLLVLALSLALWTGIILTLSYLIG
jgi:hypothetical protein